MELVTIISLVAAATTISLAIYAFLKNLRKSWKALQKKIDNLEKSLQVNQRVRTKYDINVVSGGKVVKIPQGTEVEVLAFNTENGMVTIRAFNRLLTTKTNIDNLQVDDQI